MNRLEITLVVRPSHPDFLQRIVASLEDAEEAFKRDSMPLSQAVLVLRGYIAGSWLELIPEDTEAWIKLKHEFQIYEKAREAIRGQVLQGVLEDSRYYVRFSDLVTWAKKKRIEIHSLIQSYLLVKSKPNKRGPKPLCLDTVEAVAKHYQDQGKKRITAKTLQDEQNPEMIRHREKFVREGAKNKLPDQIKRRIKKLAENVTKLLQSQTE